jgi:hypothetical protein
MKHKTVIKKWKKHKLDPSFYNFVNRFNIIKKLRKITVPENVREIQNSLDRIEENQGILVLSDSIDLATILMIFSHKNVKSINEIRRVNWVPIDLGKIKEDYAENIAEFQRLFPIDIPDFIFELHHYQECMSEFVEGWGNFRHIHEGSSNGLTSLDAGIFKHLFTVKKPKIEDALSLRYIHNTLNYFPLFSSGSYQVNRGLIFDYLENSFSPFICYFGDGDYSAAINIWEELSGVFYSDVDSFSGDELEDFEGLEEFKYDDLNRLLSTALVEYKLRDWFFNLVTVGYLNFHRMPSIKWDASDKRRFSECYSEAEFKKLSNNKASFVVDHEGIYPRFPIKIDGRFNQVFCYETLECFLSIFSYFAFDQNNFEYFVQKHSDVLALLGLQSKDWHLESKISVEDKGVYLSAVEKFCNDEIAAGRPYLAFLVGLYTWEGMEKQTTELSARLLQNVPDAICPPIIKTIARLHSVTRFDDKILV